MSREAVPGRGTFTVSQVTRYIRDILTEDVILSELVVEGELSNCNVHSSGHMYFTLKDTGAVLTSVMFRASARTLTFVPKNGMKVVCAGRVAVYEKTGQYQLYADFMKPLGMGGIHAGLELLREKLALEGLFDESRKRTLPAFPKVAAVVTSPTGAAVRDIINIISRRSPKTQIVVSPALVQGENAAESIVRAIELVNNWGGADVLIVGRGGGQQEDLQPFNDENVARAIFRSKIPVISAVGHETDFTIADETADLRAPTPSAAAELAVRDIADLRRTLDDISIRLNQHISDKIAEAREEADWLRRTLDRELHRQLAAKKSLAQNMENRLAALSPIGVLSRGYAVVSGNGMTKTSVSDFCNGEQITITVKDGAVNAIVAGACGNWQI